MLAHDPVMAKDNGKYYVFTTGPGITVWVSDDMQTWLRRPQVFDPTPPWVEVTIPDFMGHMWAPDIYHHKGLFYLYYSVSAFGKNTSCIGVATNKTLDSEDPDYQWIDHGKIIQSFPGVTDWNAIDAHVIDDENGTPYLSFGSFLEGLKIGKLMPDRLSFSDYWQDLETIASRDPEIAVPASGENPASRPLNKAVEAPFIFKHGDFYYLFVSFDRCCIGEKSDYKIAVGRSKSVTGPYVDRDGVPMLAGGGTVILTGDKDWFSVGHNSVYHFDGTDYLVFHGYDASTPAGLPRLRIERLGWDAKGWPSVIDAKRE